MTYVCNFDTPESPNRIEPCHRDDILVVGWLRAAAEFPQFNHNRVFSSNAPQRLLGRTFRNVFVHGTAFETYQWAPFFAELERIVRQRGGKFFDIDQYDLVYAEERLRDEQDELNAEAAEQIRLVNRAP
ncbi:hypothetical protein AB0J80_35895 [Actinoplanes sp. NPDC049548]|uniref:hypothetical protein n=1 Tax=Actinoplanes sp. NPDC049548 TaxID=3155152 RepID=UPI00343745C4